MYVAVIVIAEEWLSDEEMSEAIGEWLNDGREEALMSHFRQAHCPEPIGCTARHLKHEAMALSEIIIKKRNDTTLIY